MPSTRYNDFEGGHDFHYVVTPPDPTRTHYTRDDVPEWLLIDHPRRKPFVADTGGGWGSKKARERKAQRPEVSPIARKVPVKADRRKSPAPKPVWVYRDGMVTGFPGIAAAKLGARFGFTRGQQDQFSEEGWVRFRRKGLIVWLQAGPIPDCVPRPFNFTQAVST